MNVHDSEKMTGILLNEGYVTTHDPKDADLIIFNTCSIREKAEQKFQSELGKTKDLKKKKPSLRIAIAGCIAQQQGNKLFKKYSHINYVLGPQNLHMLKDMAEIKNHAVFVDENPEIECSDLPISRDNGVKAWVSIMYGCNNFCSYCIVPYTRGREKSRPSSGIYKEILELSNKGFKEVTLLGQNVNSYRSDLDFPGLLTKINTINGIERIRFVTSHPRDLSEPLILRIKELSKVCEHIHLPLQSGSDKILSLMNRGYTYEEYLRKIEKLREAIPDISITSDIIVGFPTETEYDHARTVDALQKFKFDGVFAFKFSPRPGTKASEMENSVSDGIKSERLAEILKLQDEITLSKNKILEGTYQEVLVEGRDETAGGKMTGRTRTNKIVNFDGEDSLIGQLIKIKIIKALRHSLLGKIAI